MTTIYDHRLSMDDIQRLKAAGKESSADAQPTPSPAVDALLSYVQGDEDGVFVWASRQAIHEVVSELAAQEAELAVANEKHKAEMTRLDKAWAVTAEETAKKLAAANARLADADVMAVVVRTGYTARADGWADEQYRKTTLRAQELHRSLESERAAAKEGKS